MKHNCTNHLQQVQELYNKKLEVSAHKNEEGAQGSSDTLEALEALGYSISQAREAIREIKEGSLDTSQKIKEALKYLSRP